MKLIFRKICCQWSPDWIVEADSTLHNELQKRLERPYYMLNRKLVRQCDESIGEVTSVIESFVSRVANSQRFSLTLIIINDMKRIYRKFKRSKKPSGSIHGPGPATSTSFLTSTTDPMPSIPASDATATASAQLEATAGVNVSVQFRPSHL